MNQIGEKILKLRKESGYSQDDLARRVGVVRQTISRWEAGTALPGAVELMSLCNVFGICMDYFRPDGGDADFFGSEDEAAADPGAGNLPARRRSAAPYLFGIIVFTLYVGVLSAAAVYMGVTVYAFQPAPVLGPLRLSYKYWLFLCIVIWFADVVADGMCIFMMVKVVNGNRAN